MSACSSTSKIRSTTGLKVSTGKNTQLCEKENSYFRQEAKSSRISFSWRCQGSNFTNRRQNAVLVTGPEGSRWQLLCFWSSQQDVWPIFDTRSSCWLLAKALLGSVRISQGGQGLFIVGGSWWQGTNHDGLARAAWDFVTCRDMNQFSKPAGLVHSAAVGWVWTHDTEQEPPRSMASWQNFTVLVQSGLLWICGFLCQLFDAIAQGAPKSGVSGDLNWSVSDF